MIINKSERKILNYIYKKKTVSFKRLSYKFRKLDGFQDTLYSLVHHQFVIQDGDHLNEYGEPIPFTPETKFQLNGLGRAEVESHQWFDVSYVFTSLVVPIIVGVTSSLITALLLALFT